MILQSIFSIVYFVFMVLLLFGVTIFIHELGHFWVARRLGMQADVFSIGFGHAIWKKKVNGVLYKIGWIPFGGYVALPQMEPGGGKTVDEEGNETPLPRVEPWKKIAVALAGAVGNVILAVILACVIFWVGKPSMLDETSSAIGFVKEESVAYEMGLRAGDVIKEVNGSQAENWQDVAIGAALRNSVDLVVEQSTGTIEIHLDTEAGALGIKGVRGIPGVSGPSYCIVGGTEKGASAEKAGVIARDRILAIDGIEILSIPQMKNLVEERRDQVLDLLLERDGEQLTVQVTPRLEVREIEGHEPIEGVFIGITFQRYPVNRAVLVHPPPGQQVRSHAGLIFRTLRALVTPKEAKNAAGAIGGPPMIFQYLWAMVTIDFRLALWFTCLLNVNLAIINLLPIPVLDGGHITFSITEIITRRPINERFVVRITTVFAVLLISAMIFLSYRDLDRIFSSPEATGNSESAPAESASEAPPVVE
jgi:regulator of sigma E protease